MGLGKVRKRLGSSRVRIENNKNGPKNRGKESPWSERALGAEQGKATDVQSGGMFRLAILLWKRDSSRGVYTIFFDCLSEFCLFVYLFI